MTSLLWHGVKAFVIALLFYQTLRWKTSKLRFVLAPAWVILTDSLFVSPPSLSTLESDKNQSATLIIRQLCARLSKGLLSYEQWKANYNGIQSPYLLLLFNVNSLCNQAALSPAPTDDPFKLTSHPHFPVNANSSSQPAQLKSYCGFPNHYSCK